MLYPTWRFFAFPVYGLWLGKVEGIENVPRDKPFIIAANHSSYYDTILIHSILIPKLNKKIHAFVNSAYWKIPIVRNILDKGECIPVYVKKDKDAEANRKAFQAALTYLKKGEIVQIFPEGARSFDGKLKKGYTGIAKLALSAKVPIIPVGIIGSNKVLPKGKFFPRFKRCKVRVGKPMNFEKYQNNSKSYLQITTKIMKEIAKLIGQDYEY